MESKVDNSTTTDFKRGLTMGSYLELDNRETNSKSISKVLIDAIRELDKRIQSKPYMKEMQLYFIAEEYREDGTGVGDWKIHRKGMALLVTYLDELKDDRIILSRMAKERHEYTLEHCRSEEYNNTLERLTNDVKETVEWCESYAIKILVDMVLHERTHVDAVWI